LCFKFSDDFGKLAENLVFIELKRRCPEVYYHSGKKECDFIIKERTKIFNKYGWDLIFFEAREVNESNVIERLN